jgi:hypothetical protein
MTITDINFDPLTPTIFHEPWWLDIASEGRYAVAEVVEQGKVVGRLPYYLKKKLGIVVCGRMPPLTHFLGPAIVECEGKPSKKFSHRHHVTKELILKLPKTSCFYLKCHRGVADVVAFQGCGFRTGVQFTQEILPRSLDEIWQNMSGKARQQIRGAAAHYSVATGDDPDSFMHFYAEFIKKSKGANNCMNTKVHANIIRASLNRGRGKIYEAREANGSLASAMHINQSKIAAREMEVELGLKKPVSRHARARVAINREDYALHEGSGAPQMTTRRKRKGGKGEGTQGSGGGMASAMSVFRSSSKKTTKAPQRPLFIAKARKSYWGGPNRRHKNIYVPVERREDWAVYNI